MISGRSHLMTALRHAAGRILAGEGGANTVVLSGEAGIGKTTLLDAFVEKLRSAPEPPLVVRAVCSTPLAGHDIGEVEALAPWAGIVAELAAEKNEALVQGRSLVGKLALAWVRCIPVVGDVIESAADTALILKGESRRREQKITGGGIRNQEQMFRQCINLLAAVSESTPLVVIIDDMHWSDTSSTNLLFSAARELADRPIAFILAYRPDEADVSRGGEGHPVVRVIGELRRYDLVTELDVPGLSSDALVELLRGRYHNYSGQPRFEEWLRRISSGNPLFIVQFLATLEEDGLIDATTGEVTSGYREARIPDSARAVVDERIRRLEPDARDLLRYASVEGETFSTLLLGKVSEMSRLKMLSTLRRLEEEHRVVSTLGKQTLYGVDTTLYRFRHPLIQRELYRSLGDEEREVLHEEMFRVLSETGEEARTRGEVLRDLGPRLAAHAEVLGRYRDAARALMEGAEASWTELAVEETLRMVEGAIDNVERARKSEPYAADLYGIEAKGLRSIGRIRRYRGDYAAALDAVERAVEAAEHSDDPKHLVGARLDRANTLRYLGRLDEAETDARKGLEIARSASYRAGEAGAFNSLGTILYPGGRLEEAVEAYMEALDIEQEEGDTLGQAQTLSNLGNAFRALGDTAEAARCYRKSLDLSAESDNLVSWGVALLHLGNLSRSESEYGEALDYYRQSQELGERIGYRELLVHSLMNIGAVERIRGNLKESAESLEEVSRLIADWPVGRVAAELEIERGHLEAVRVRESEGETTEGLSRAIDHLTSALSWFRDQGDTARVREIEADIGALRAVER